MAMTDEVGKNHTEKIEAERGGEPDGGGQLHQAAGRHTPRRPGVGWVIGGEPEDVYLRDNEIVISGAFSLSGKRPMARQGLVPCCGAPGG